MSKDQESKAKGQPEDVVASVKPLMLGDPARLYHFGDVGAVFAVAQSVGAVLTATHGGKDGGNEVETQIRLPAGNWLIVSVGALAGMDCPHVSAIDNPFDVREQV